jgi:Na+/H+-dicarboxylate symporter
MAKTEVETMSTKVQAPPASITRPASKTLLWPLVVALVAMALAVAALVVFRPGTGAVRDTTRPATVNEHPGVVTTRNDSLVQGGLHPIPFSPVISADDIVAGAGVDHSAQQR